VGTTRTRNYRTPNKELIMKANTTKKSEGRPSIGSVVTSGRPSLGSVMSPIRPSIRSVVTSVRNSNTPKAKKNITSEKEKTRKV
jgi:hypothetical protein